MTEADPVGSWLHRRKKVGSSLRRRSAPVSQKLLKSFNTPVPCAGSAPVAPLCYKSLILLDTPVRAGLRHCVPHTPYSWRVPPGRRASVTKGIGSPPTGELGSPWNRYLVACRAAASRSRHVSLWSGPELEIRHFLAGSVLTGRSNLSFGGRSFIGKPTPGVFSCVRAQEHEKTDRFKGFVLE